METPDVGSSRARIARGRLESCGPSVPIVNQLLRRALPFVKGGKAVRRLLSDFQRSRIVEARRSQV